MKNKTFSPLIVALFLIISVGVAVAFLLFAGIRSFFMIDNVSGSPAEPVIGSNAFEDHPAAEGYEIDVEEAAVDRVEVEFGNGSPLPVQVVVSGRLPDSCSQVEFVKMVQDGTEFEILLSAVKSQANECLQDTIPFKMRIPLNVVYLPGGEYSVVVNGVQEDFSYENGSSTGLLWTSNHSLLKEEIEIVQIEVENGVGPTGPVHLRISGDLPSTCAQLGEIWMQQGGSTFYVRLSAYTPEGAGCTQNSLPFWLEIPLNITTLPEGRYAADVNGETISFEIPLP